MNKRMLILIGPSGVGKSTFLERTLEDYPHFVDIITCTSRPMRKGESEGKPYHFLTEEEFLRRVDTGYFAEWARVHNRLYGTPQDQIEATWKRDKIVIMDVDVQGAKTLRAKFPQALTIFILPPSIDSLRQRVVSRDGKVPEDIEIRMQSAEREIAQARDFDLQITNKDFHSAYAEYRKIIEDRLKIK